jgi:transposase
MPTRLILTLTDAEIVDLRTLRDRHPIPYLRERAAAILKVAAGESTRAVAAHGLLRPRRHDTVARWIHRYQADGLNALRVRPGRGRKPAFSPPA